MASAIQKYLQLLAIGCVTGTFLFAQKTEFHSNVYSGLFTFRGNGAGHVYYRTFNHGSVYGKQPAYSYSFELLTQRVTRGGHLFGLGTAFEKLESQIKTALSQADSLGSGPPPGPARTKIILSNSFLTFTPFIGQRFFHKAVTLDVIAGVDFANYLKNKVKSKISDDGGVYKYHYTDKKLSPSLDIRPRLQLNANYKRFSFLAGYSRGITNYRKNPDIKTYSNFLRIGAGYKIK